MHDQIDLTALVLSTVCVADDDGQSMSAEAIAFLLDVPQEEINFSLGELVALGSIREDGGDYRLTRPLVASDLLRIDRLHDQLEQLRPIVEMIPVRLRPVS